MTPWINYKIIKIKIKRREENRTLDCTLLRKLQVITNRSPHLYKCDANTRISAPYMLFQWSCSPKSICFLKTEVFQKWLDLSIFKKEQCYISLLLRKHLPSWMKEKNSKLIAFSSDTSFNRILRFSSESWSSITLLSNILNI